MTYHDANLGGPPSPWAAASVFLPADRNKARWAEAVMILAMSGSPDGSGLLEFADFQRVDMRVGRVVTVEDFPQARNPAWKLTIDFGPEVGLRRSSARITHYSREALEDSLVVGVVNLTPRQVGPFVSEALVLGAIDDRLGVVLLRPDADAAPGDRIG